MRHAHSRRIVITSTLAGTRAAIASVRELAISGWFGCACGRLGCKALTSSLVHRAFWLRFLFLLFWVVAALALAAPASAMRWMACAVAAGRPDAVVPVSGFTALPTTAEYTEEGAPGWAPEYAPGSIAFGFIQFKI